MSDSSNSQPNNKPENRRQGDRRKNANGAPPPGSVVDRRLGIDRRDREQSGATGLERRRGRGRRLSEFTKAAEEGEMNTEQFLFLMAVESFKKSNDRAFPTWSDVLEVIRLLGYRKTMPMELTITNADDWTEAPNAPANVRPDRWAERFSDEEHAQMNAAPALDAPKNDDGFTKEALEALEAMEDAFGDDAPDQDDLDLLSDAA